MDEIFGVSGWRQKEEVIKFWETPPAGTFATRPFSLTQSDQIWYDNPLKGRFLRGRVHSHTQEYRAIKGNYFPV